MANMNSRSGMLFPLLGVLLAVLLGSVAYAEPDFKLKKGARGKLCVDCHDAIQELLKKRFVHTPLAEGECTGCHNPHTSDHTMLLAVEPEGVCYECHDEMLVPEAESIHQVVAEGKCASCHSPHASDNEMVLLKAGKALCFECHEELGEKIEANEFGHDPVEEDCLECHNPHLSEKNPKLLKDGDPSLCVECHDTGKSIFKTVHENYPVQKGSCVGCHDPHGSNTAAILYDNVHEPMADRECSECHASATSAAPFALKESGYELCEGCHYEMIVDVFNKKRVHWPLLDETGCINCHSPHGSSEDSLIKNSLIVVCGKCHGDTVARQERSRTKHEPVQEGECAECHSPHSSDNLFILNESSNLDLCGTCHEWQTHSTHPIGAEIIDPRNQNLSMQCLSCHRTHGTEYKHFLYFGTTKDMCIQCHTDYRR
jgi:predicted CXXCH cytochrome family protein